MTLLDRFRTQTRHKHPDPAVRLSYVAEIPLDDREMIAAIAREDEDPRVRRAAVGKLMDAAALGAIARDDADEDVRGAASDMLRDLALEVFEGTGESESLDAVDAISDPRALAQVAKTAGREIVAVRALSRTNDVHSLGSIARHASSEAVRRAAFERLHERSEHAEIMAVAMNSEFKDTAIAAVEVLTDPVELEQVASRGRNKAAGKRARGILREAEEQAARELAASRHEEPAAAPGPSAEDVSVSESSDVVVEQPAEAVEAELSAEEVERRRLEAEAERQRAEEAERRREELAAQRAREVEEHERQEAERRARLAEAREAEQRARREALARLHNLLGRVEPLITRSDVTLKAADRALRDVRTALNAIPPLPSRQDFEEVARRLRAAQDGLTPKVLELREADDWQRWANVSVQEQLIAKMEGLRALDDAEAIAREVRSLQEQWKKVADVPRPQADALWRRFKTAHDEVWAKCEAYFASEAQARAENLAKKNALCEKAEALAESTSWIQTAEEIKTLQAEWKAIGPVSRGREKAIWDRFRTACDRFFTRRHDDLAQRKKLWGENLAKKDALCVRAEALAESSDWEPAAAEIRRLQNEWKTVGPVKKSRSEAVWQRFRAACDKFFTRYAQRHDIARAERVAAREAICDEMAALAPPPRESASAPAPQAPPPRESASASAPQAPPPVESDSASASQAPDAVAEQPPADLLAQVRALRGRWQQEIAARGVDPERAQALDRRFTDAFAAVVARWPSAFAGSDLDPEANRKRMETLVRRVEDLASSIAGPAAAQAEADAAMSPTVRLAAMLKEALAANTIGGRVDDDSRTRAAAEEVRQAQASWSRIGPVPDDVKRALADRFQRAVRRINDRMAAKSGKPSGLGRPGR
jgi:hypothetical protein